MDWTTLAEIQTAPALFEPSGQSIWTDRYISSHILYAHLDSTTDDGSRPLPVIQQEARWLESLKPGLRGRFLDLGCGPGLHCRLMALAGWKTTGIDISAASIAYAREAARDEALAIDYKHQDFLKCPWPSGQDLIFLGYGTFGVLSPSQVKTLLTKAAAALPPDGLLVLDTFTRTYWERERAKDPQEPWFVQSEDGFWAQGAHLVLIRRFDYLGEQTFVRQYTVIQDRQRPRTYRFWYRWYEEEEIIRLLSAAGFQPVLFGDLTGRGFDADGDWIAVVARPRGERHGS